MFRVQHKIFNTYASLVSKGCFSTQWKMNNTTFCIIYVFRNVLQLICGLWITLSLEGVNFLDSIACLAITNKAAWNLTTKAVSNCNYCESFIALTTMSLRNSTNVNEKYLQKSEESREDNFTLSVVKESLNFT